MGPLALIGPALQFLTGSGELSKLARYGLIAVAALAAYGFWHHKIFTDGREYERGLIADQNREALENARGMVSKVRECKAKFGDDAWDRVAVRCKH